MADKPKEYAGLEADFRKDLDALLEKHSAVLDITDSDESYGMHRGIVVVSIIHEYDHENDRPGVFCEFTLDQGDYNG